MTSASPRLVPSPRSLPPSPRGFVSTPSPNMVPASAAALLLAREQAIANAPQSVFEAVETASGVLQGVKVTVFLADDSDETTITCANADVTAKQLCAEMAKKEGLRPESHGLFSLWIVGNELELQLKPDQDLLESVEKFPRYVEKYTHRKVSDVEIRWRFVYKREAMVRLETDRKVKDPNAIRLLYLEAVANVLSTRYPLVNENDAVYLAAIQMQIDNGDHTPEVHKAGFLISEDRLRGYVPKCYFVTSFLAQITRRAMRPADWEDRILQEHKKLRNKPQMICQLLYLQFVRQFPFYGATYFTACFNLPPRGFFEYRDENILLAVSTDSISLIHGDQVKLIKSYRFDDINWDATKDTFIIESGDEHNPDITTLISPQSHLVASLVTRAIKNLDKNDRKMEALRQRQRHLHDAAVL